MTGAKRVFSSRSRLLLVLFLVACAGPRSGTVESRDAGAGDGAESDAAALIAAIGERHGLPALAVLVLAEGEVRLRSFSGVRKQGDTALVSPNDRWHIGSNTKAMSATLIGTFVEDGSVRFDTRLREVFPELAERFHPDAIDITLEHLLNHRAGFRRSLLAAPRSTLRRSTA